MKLIVGLGNPGKEYEKTRHNIGFIILNKYLKKHNISNLKEDFSSKYIKTKINNENVIFQKPQTYMNLSGNAIYQIAKYYKIKNEDILVIYDDMSLNLGEIKIKNKGSSAGHNGIKSIITNLGEIFNRLKIGIGKPKNKDVINYVLGNFSKEEEEAINNLDDHLFKIIDAFIENVDYEKIISKYTIKKQNKEVKNQLQLAKIKDIDQILQIKEMAIKYQLENNNIQWKNNYLVKLI